jgi:hypothetical protein
MFLTPAWESRRGSRRSGAVVRGDHAEALDTGLELDDGGTRHRVEQPPNPRAFGYAWATRLDGAE